MITKTQFNLYEEARKKLKIKIGDKKIKNVIAIMEVTELDLKIVMTIMDKHKEVKLLVKRKKGVIRVLGLLQQCWIRTS